MFTASFFIDLWHKFCVKLFLIFSKVARDKKQRRFLFCVQHKSCKQKASSANNLCTTYRYGINLEIFQI